MVGESEALFVPVDLDTTCIMGNVVTQRRHVLLSHLAQRMGMLLEGLGGEQCLVERLVRMDSPSTCTLCRVLKAAGSDVGPHLSEGEPFDRCIGAACILSALLEWDTKV